MTRIEKWATKRAEIEKESEELKQIIKNDENTEIFDEMMGNPLEEFDQLSKYWTQFYGRKQNETH